MRAGMFVTGVVILVVGIGLAIVGAPILGAGDAVGDACGDPGFFGPDCDGDAYEAGWIMTSLGIALLVAGGVLSLTGLGLVIAGLLSEPTPRDAPVAAPVAAAPTRPCPNCAASAAYEARYCAACGAAIAPIIAKR